MDLVRQDYPSNSGMLGSKSVVVALYVGKMYPTRGKQYLDYASRDDVTHLMDRRYLPSNEPIWTCRVWVKRVLDIAEQHRYIDLPASLGKSRYRAHITLNQY